MAIDVENQEPDGGEPTAAGGGGDTTWACGSCTLLNDAIRRRCDVCQADRPTPKPTAKKAAAAKPKKPAGGGKARRGSGAIAAGQKSMASFLGASKKRSASND